MKILNASEIIQVAVKLEDNGERFYRHAEKIADVKEAKEIFKYLADEEVKHKAVFEDLLSKVGKLVPGESYTDEYAEYLSAYVDNIIFTEQTRDENMYAIRDTLSAVEFGLQREAESITYYQEVKRVVPEDQHGLIDEIIEEERKHFMTLSVLKKKHDQKMTGILKA